MIYSGRICVIELKKKHNEKTLSKQVYLLGGDYKKSCYIFTRNIYVFKVWLFSPQQSDDFTFI